MIDINIHRDVKHRRSFSSYLLDPLDQCRQPIVLSKIDLFQPFSIPNLPKPSHFCPKRTLVEAGHAKSNLDLPAFAKASADNVNKSKLAGDCRENVTEKRGE